jgi:hypothetical protein
MTDQTRDPGAPRRRRIGWTVGLLAAGAVGGGVIMATVPAMADPTPSPSSSAATSSSEERHGRGGGQRSDETVLTGADADKAKAAALAAVPGASVDRVETDADGAVYEAHVTKSDGTKATVKFDKDFKVTGIEDGMGAHK